MGQFRSSGNCLNQPQWRQARALCYSKCLMSRRVRQFLPLVLFAISAFLFLIADRAAYKGYFTADEINNMAFTRWGTTGDFVLDLLSPRFYANNFRPVGHFFFLTMGRVAGQIFSSDCAYYHISYLAIL